ncbi:MAG: thermonuclease family protein [Candidatus Andersenbacteria bacterium]|nr:thermonuclease family protein [Candidatus Andersenbacteria bacterium]
MKFLKPIALSILLVVALQQPAFAATKPTSLYPVTKVIDGDTIDVQIGTKTERIRIVGMDTPETVDPRKPVQCFGKEASNKAKTILTGKKVRLESDPVSGERDKYGRLLRYVYLENGTSFEKLMILDGYAHEYTYNSIPYKYQADFKKAQKDAQTKKRGLWSPTSCNGNTVQAAKAPAISTSAPAVKKSVNNLCHAKGTKYYDQTKKFTPYSTVKACLANGGKMPK